MISATLTAKIFSTLGNNSSLIPIGIKDATHSLGMTTGSYITGNKVEGKDRFIDEFGTQAIWLGGIPFFKKMIDLTVYKVAKYNPKVDIRVLKDEKILAMAKAYAPKNLKEGFKKISDNKTIFKGLFIAKFIAATALTFASYSALTHFRHKQTEKAIVKEIVKEEQLKKQELMKTPENLIGKNATFKAFGYNAEAKKSKFGPSFGMNFSKAIGDFMFNPVKNMMIVDAGITTQRLTESRNPQDFKGYVIKEGAFWLFMYFAGERIQKFFEKRAKAKHGKSIDLDIRVLQNAELKKSFESAEIAKDLNAFPQYPKELTKEQAKKKELVKIYKAQVEKSDVEIYKFVNDNPTNLVVKMAKESGIIKTFKNSDKIDTQKFIDIADVKGIHSKIEKLHSEFKNPKMAKIENIDEFFKGATKLKRFAILKNIGACMAVLGVVVPGVMLAARLAKKDNKDFKVKQQVREKLMAQNFQGVV